MDLNGDGILDILTGSWPGELFLFKGEANGSFAAPEMIRNKDGEIINIGGGIEKREDGTILITGNAEFEKTPEGTYVNYHGKRMESTPENPISVTGCASAVHASDWDGDGDLDLLIGDIDGNVHLVPNEGTAETYAFGKEKPLLIDNEPLCVDGNAGPFAADWDHDGDLDLLVGCSDGSVSFFCNTGGVDSPELAPPEQIVPPGHDDYGKGAPKEARRGGRAKVCAADWNGDGKLDLLLGDFTTQKPDLLEPTSEEKAEHDKARAELDKVYDHYRTLSDRMYGESRTHDEKEREQIEKEQQEVYEQIRELRAKIPPEYENHGWVWLFLRK